MVERARCSALLLLLFSLLLTAGLLPATVQADDEGFTTEHFDVKMSVAQDNSATVSEAIQVRITTPMHGVYRYIPLSQKIDYQLADDRIKSVRNPVKVENLMAENDPYDVYKDSGNMVIQIGDPDVYVDGAKEYNLSYKVGMYDDANKEYDSFYYNVLPHKWGTSIKNATVTLTMPKKFKKANVDVAAGPRGSDEDTDKIRWEVKNQTITITTKGELPKGSGITVGIKLPEGYFSGELSTFPWKLMFCALCLVVAAAMGLFWFRFGRDRQTVQTVEFEPPSGIDPAEAGYIIDGKVDRRDVIALIFWFAQKGFLTIEEEEAKKDNFRLHKVADLPEEAKSFERTFFNGIFADSLEGSISMDDLGEAYVNAYEATREQVRSHFTESGKRRIFPKAVSKARIAAFAMTIAGFVAATIVAEKIYASWWVVVPVALVCVLTLMACGLGIRATDRKYAMSLGGRISSNLFGILLLVIAVLLAVFFAWKGVAFPICGLALALLMVAAYLSIRFMQSRTKYGAEMLGKLLGFREFIKEAEVAKLEELIEDNPSYFYDVLPYAYAMGLSKKWARKFEEIPTEQPAWYRGGTYDRGGFNTWVFYHSFDNLGNVASARSAIDLGEDGGFGGLNSGGGSFGGGGGGFSGGGFGGGGGGGW